MKDHFRFDLTEEIRREQAERKLRADASLVIMGFTIGVLLTVLVFSLVAGIARTL